MRKISFLLVLLWIETAYGQSSDSSLTQLADIPANFMENVDANASKWENKLVSRSTKYLKKLARTEVTIKRKLTLSDSNIAKQLFEEASEKYRHFQEKLNATTGSFSQYGHTYIALLDSVKTALNFLQQGNISLIKSTKLAELQSALSRISSLQGKLNQAEEIRDFIRERKQFLEEQLGRLGLLKELRKFRKEAWYFQAELIEFKQAINEPDKLISKSIYHLQKLESFQEFFRQHSQLASMFRLPANGAPVDPAVLNGMQTREALQNLLQQRFGSGSVNVEQMLQQQVSQAQSQLTQLRDKMSKIGNASSELPMPDFKPNSMKTTKNIWKKLELGINIQSVRANNFLPVTTDVGLSAGFKPHDKTILGVGFSGKIGWGSDIRHMSISYQGVGIRSFIEHNKGFFHLTGGYEMNYRHLFSEFEQLKEYNAWSKSALIGLTKKYKVGNKLKGSIQFLYDLLWRDQVPQSKPLLFRVGYYFR
jgi:hypothetical protein